VRELLLSDDFLWQVVRELRLNIADKDFRQFKNTMKVEQVKDTNMLNISIETSDRKEGRAVLEKMVALFKNQSRPDLERHRQLLTDQLGSVKARLLDVEKIIRETRENLAALETASGLTRAEKDFRRSQLLETLQGFESQRLALLDRYLDLQKELNALEDVRIIRSPREPVYPVKPNKKLNIALAGVLGLMIGVLGAFVIEFFRKNPLPRG
ncbi:MAG: GNVR domain-containing protein, partial [Desulfotomaculales bacterium]